MQNEWCVTLLRGLAKAAEFFARANNLFSQGFRRVKFKSCGKRVTVGPRCSLHYSKISVGNDVFIGEGAIFHATVHGITIGNKVMFGPEVVIMGGDHRFDVIGQEMADIKVKLRENDQLIVIEDDVWIGARVIILKGVRIGVGCVIGAGSVVTHDVPPYSIYTGVPLKRIRARWTAEQIAAHQTLLKSRTNQR